jgi:alginate O-acetyltransferase complex protein AlgI
LPLQKLPGLLRHGYVLLVILISFVIFNAQTMTQALEDIGGLFGLAGVPLVTTQSLYALRSYGVLILVAMVGATPWITRLAILCQRKWPVVSWLGPVAALALLLICTAYLVDGSFNPFLYFRF